MAAEYAAYANAGKPGGDLRRAGSPGAREEKGAPVRGRRLRDPRMSDSERLVANGTAARRAYGDAERAILSGAEAAIARAEIASWPGYSPTPLRRLASLAERLGIAAVDYKDESQRFGIGSFKAQGGAYAVLRALERRLGVEASGASPADLREGEGRERASTCTTTCATAGNHGRAVAWGSEMFGCRCVIFLPAGADEARAEAIRRHGATVIRTDDAYDAAVEIAHREAEANDWIVISDTAYGDYEQTPRDVMHGYTTLAQEAIEQREGRRPTHVFIQAGVGGLSTAVCGWLWERFGADRPVFVLVEPSSAGCFGRSIEARGRVELEGPFDTMMGGLASGVPSTLAWRLLAGCADFAMTISDASARRAMRTLADGPPPVVAGESGAAGLAGLIEAAGRPDWRAAIGLNEHSEVLLVGSEGAMAPEAYERIVGRAPAEVLRQRADGA